jgi:hypothetical protein
MRRLKFGRILVAAALASAVAVPIFAAPASAAPTNGCTSTAQTGNAISMFPVVPGGASSVLFACTQTTVTTLANEVGIFEDFPGAVYHWGAGRNAIISSFTTNTITTPACPAIGCGHFTANDVNHPISGPGIPARAFIKSATATVATLNISGVTAGTTTYTGFTQPLSGYAVTVTVATPLALSVGERIVAGVAAVNKGEYQVVKITGTAVILRNLGASLGVAPGGAVGAGTFSPLANSKIAIVENSDGRSFADGVVDSAHLTVVCSLTANFGASDVNRFISGGTTAASLAPFTKITAASATTPAWCAAGSSQATITPAAPAGGMTAATLSTTAAGYPCNPLPVAGTSACGASTQKINGVAIPAGQAPYTTTTRQINDANYTLVAGAVCSLTAKFGPTDIGLPISNVANPGVYAMAVDRIPARDYITAVTVSGTSTCATLNAATAGASTNAFVVIGEPNATAPSNDDPAIGNATQLSLSPALVAGQPACTTNTLAGFSLQGKWSNPGSFGSGGGPYSSTQLKKPAIAQYGFVTSVLTFNAYLLQVPAGAAVAPRHQTQPHMELILPLIPTGGAVCPPPSTVGEASTFTIPGFSPSQAARPQGIGVTGSSVLRGLNDRNTAIATVPGNSAFWISTSATAPNPTWFATQTCNIAVGGTFGFPCGVG